MIALHVHHIPYQDEFNIISSFIDISPLSKTPAAVTTLIFRRRVNQVVEPR
jgi:hypothetical protein